MPIYSCYENGRPGYRWGENGKCYTYQQGDDRSRRRAKQRAEAQGRAAYASGYKGDSK